MWSQSHTDKASTLQFIKILKIVGEEAKPQSNIEKVLKEKKNIEEAIVGRKSSVILNILIQRLSPLMTIPKLEKFQKRFQLKVSKMQKNNKNPHSRQKA